MRLNQSMNNSLKNIFFFAGPDDADFVQVVHTDSLERGILAASGHVDFYSKSIWEFSIVNKNIKIYNHSMEILLFLVNGGIEQVMNLKYWAYFNFKLKSFRIISAGL